MSVEPPIEIKARVTAEHVGLYERLKGSKNRAKLLTSYAMLGVLAEKQCADGAPMVPNDQAADVTAKPVKRRKVAFSGGGEDP